MTPPPPHTRAGCGVEPAGAPGRAVHRLKAAFAAALLLTLAAALAPQDAQAEINSTTLTATAGTEQVELSWTTVPARTLNVLEWQYQQNGGSWISIDGSGNTTRSHTVTGLVGGTAFRFRVRAKLDKGFGAFSFDGTSNEATATPTAAARPGVTLSTTSLQVAEGSSNTYTVVLDTAPSSTVTITVGGESGEVTVTGSPLTFTNSDYGTAQTVTVNAGADPDTTDDSATLTHTASSSDTDYNSLSIDSVQVTVTDTTPTVSRPASPTGLAAAAGNAEVTLSWADPSDASITGYQLRYGETSVRDSAGWIPISGSDASTTSHTVTSLDNDAEYSFQVLATNGAGDGDASAWVTATPTGPDDGGSNDGDGDDGGGDDGDDGNDGSDGGDPGGGSGDNGGGTSDDDDDSGNDDDDNGDDGSDGDDDDAGDDSDDDVPPAVPPTASFTLSASCADGLCRARTGASVSFTDTSTGTVASRTWSFGDGGAGSSSRSPRHTWSAPGFYTVSLTVSGEGSTSTTSRKVLVEAGDPAGSCTVAGDTRCLRESRFSVAVEWWTEDGEARKAGKVVHEGTDDSGLFWFFSETNWELLLKVLDGCSLNGHVWVFGASATTLGYSIRVTDTVTGAMKEYRNEPGNRSSAITDASAFPDACSGAGAAAGALASAPPAGGDPVAALLPVVTVPSAVESGSCTPAAGTLCLQDGRYAVSVDWTDREGDTGKGSVAPPRADDSGLFWFFSEANWELLVKVLDACTSNGHHWVFAASATDVGFDLQVRDTVTDQVRRYTHTAGAPARALADVTAFPDACTP